jgi:uncharacterized protein YeaO (DUF488 family)
MFESKRVYLPPSPDDGTRILIDRLWPRGIRRVEARIVEWRKDLAPSEELRTWYSHDPSKFPRFRERYRAELFHHRDALVDLLMEGERGRVTLVYAARDAQRCNATVLQELLQELSEASTGPPLPSDDLVRAPRSGTRGKEPRRHPGAGRQHRPTRRATGRPRR